MRLKKFLSSPGCDGEYASCDWSLRRILAGLSNSVSSIKYFFLNREGISVKSFITIKGK